MFANFKAGKVSLFSILTECITGQSVGECPKGVSQNPEFWCAFPGNRLKKIY